MEEVGDDDVEVEEAVGLGLLLRLLGIGIGSRDVDDGKVKMGDGAAGGSEEGLEGAVGRHRHQGQPLLVLGGASGAVAVGSGVRRERHSCKVRETSLRGRSVDCCKGSSGQREDSSGGPWKWKLTASGGRWRKKPAGEAKASRFRQTGTREVEKRRTATMRKGIKELFP